MSVNIGLLLAGAGWVALWGIATFQMEGSRPPVRMAEATDVRRVIVAQASPPSKAKAPRRKSSGSMPVQGAAPGWPTGVPVTGGQAAQDAAGPVPDAGEIGGPSISDPGPNW